MYRRFQTTSCASSAQRMCVTKYCSGLQLNPFLLPVHANYDAARNAQLSALSKTSTPAQNFLRFSRLLANAMVYPTLQTTCRCWVANRRARKQVRPVRDQQDALCNVPKCPVHHTKALQLSYPEIPSEPTDCSARPPRLVRWIPAPDIKDA